LTIQASIELERGGGKREIPGRENSAGGKKRLEGHRQGTLEKNYLYESLIKGGGENPKEIRAASNR